MDDILALVIFIMFTGAVFAGGLYVGYRYRDNISAERHKRRRQSEQRTAYDTPTPMPAHARPLDTAEYE
jgi:hypothetical protein